jgi:hypothetical protein
MLGMDLGTLPAMEVLVIGGHGAEVDRLDRAAADGLPEAGWQIRSSWLTEHRPASTSQMAM